MPRPSCRPPWPPQLAASLPADLLSFRKPEHWAPPPGASPLLAVVLLAMECAGSVADLATWWRDHQPAVKRLAPAELAQAIAAKDLRKHALVSAMPTWHPEEPAA